MSPYYGPHNILWGWHIGERVCPEPGFRHVVGRCQCGLFVEAKDADEIAAATQAHHPLAKWVRWPDLSKFA